VLPAAWIASLLVQELYPLINRIDLDLPQWAVQLIICAISPAVFIYVGARTAPSHHFYAAIGLAILTCSLAIATLILHAVIVHKLNETFVMTCLSVNRRYQFSFNLRKVLEGRA
jgi:hypothetical protein